MIGLFGFGLWIVEWSYWVEFRFVGCRVKVNYGLHKEGWKLFYSISPMRITELKLYFVCFADGTH